MTHHGEPTQAYDFDEENQHLANPTFDSVLGARLSRRGLHCAVAWQWRAWPCWGAFSLSAWWRRRRPVVPRRETVGLHGRGQEPGRQAGDSAGLPASVVQCAG